MKSKPAFINATQLYLRVADYFRFITGEYHLEDIPIKTPVKGAPETQEQKVWDRPPEPPTLSGLAHFLGFESRPAFEAYENGERYGWLLKRARLQIEAEYEKKLHYQSSTGAIFALKSFGWNEKEDKPGSEEEIIRTLRIEILESGPAPAGSEREVQL